MTQVRVGKMDMADPEAREEEEAIGSFTITNSNGVKLTCISLGATITGLHLPTGTDIVLGYKDIKDYRTNRSYIGCSVGRVANRIGNGKFTLDGQAYQLTANAGPNHLHGGEEGFHKANWVLQTETDSSVTLQHVSPAETEGYPGNLTALVTYTLTEANEVHIEYTATTDARTIVNLTNHSYFNLAGKGTVHDHILTLNAETYTPAIDSVLIGTVEPVAKTGLDFRKPTALGQRMDEVGGYDHNFNLITVKKFHPTDPSLKHCATLEEVESGNKLDVYTNQPGVQLYSGNFLDGSYTGKDGLPIEKHAGVCLETQAWPNAINNHNLAIINQMVLRPGQKYYHKTVWALNWPKKQ